MPVWLTLFGSLVATAGFFAALYAVIIGVIEAKRAKASPRMGVTAGENPGTLAFWIWWNPAVFAVQVYRLRLVYYCPDSAVKDGQFTVSWDPPHKVPLYAEVQLPDAFRKIVEDSKVPDKAVVSVEFRTVEELTILRSYRLGQLRKWYHGKNERVPAIESRLNGLQADHATVMTLDYPDLVARKKKLKDLEAQAKAKAAAKAAAPAKPAPAPAPAPATKSAPSPAPSNGEKVASVTKASAKGADAVVGKPAVAGNPVEEG
jgi:hypothetical protein